MEVLELEPLKKKSLKLILVESEFPIDWWFEAPTNEKHDLVWNLRLITNEYLKLVGDLVDIHHPNFAVEGKGSRWEGTFSQDDPLVSLFRDKNITYRLIDISENAEGYLSVALDDNRKLIKQLSRRIEELIKINGRNPKEEFDFQRIVAWKQYLQQEYESQENEIRYKVREAWMMMKILNISREIEGNKVKALFICDARHFDGINNLAMELGIKTEIIKLKRSTEILNYSENSEIESVIGRSILKLTPIKIKKKDTSDKICYFFDTDNNASPFDINMAYDAGFDVVVPISKMTADQVPKLVQDAIFSRKPKAPTTFFIGGSNVKEGEKIAKKVIKSLVPPFECPVIVDPRGSHTTASAVVAKTIELAIEHGIDDLKDKKVVILGAGPVGRIAAIIAAKLNCKPYLVETWDKSSEKFVKDLAKDLTKEAGEESSDINGVFAPTDDQKFEILKDADIIWSLAAAGIEVLSNELLTRLSGRKFIVDINLVPPYGVKGLKPKDYNNEIHPGIVGVGALALGHLKSNIEAKILKEAANTKGKKVFNYEYAFEVGKKLLFGSIIQVLH